MRKILVVGSLENGVWSTGFLHIFNYLARTPFVRFSDVFLGGKLHYRVKRTNATKLTIRRAADENRFLAVSKFRDIDKSRDETGTSRTQTYGQ